MNNYYVYYEILSYNFCIITHDLILLNKQIEHISKFCITPPIFNKLENTINIEYIENKPLFNSLLNEFNTNAYEVLNTFEHERHYKLAINGSIYFLQPPNKYIVKKTNNYNFTVIGDGEKETIKYVFRIIREILVRFQENNSKFFFHATSLKINDKGISILGNSGSGKTTLFSSLLFNECKILSNDRTFFYNNNGRFMMDYFPIPVVYKIGTVKNNESLNNYILKDNHYSLPNNFYLGKRSYPVPLTDIPKIFKKVSLIESTNLDILIFSKFILTKSNYIAIKELTPEDSLKLLKSVCFTPVDTESLRSEWIYTRNKTDLELYEDANKFLNALVISTKIFYLEFGREVNNLFQTICRLGE